MRRAKHCRRGPFLLLFCDFDSGVEPENRMRILHRYILAEMLKILALALAAMAGAVCFVLLLPALQSFGLGPWASLQYMGLLMPRAVFIVLPLAAILAGTLVYGRLAADSEVMACRASGIAPASLFWPTILLALVATVAMGVLASWPLPASNYAAKQLARSDIERLFFSQLGSSGHIRVKEANFTMSVDRVVGDMLYGPTLKYRGTNGQTYCYAPYGRVEFDPKTNHAKLALWEAVVVDEAHTVPVRGTHTVGITLPSYIPMKEDDLSLWYLLAILSRPELSDQVRLLPEDASEQAIETYKKSARARCLGELHGRLATVTGCFGLVLVGAALGLRLHSGHLLTAFGVAIVPWVISYLLTLVAVKSVFRQTDAPQDFVWRVWTPNLAVVALGLALVAYLSWYWPSPVRLRDRLRRRPG